jgi:flagellar hook-length control protein FliK
LEKALNGPAAPGRSGKTKAIAPRLKSPGPEGRGKAEKPSVAGTFENRKLLKPRRENRQTNARLEAEKPPVDTAALAASAGMPASPEKTGQDFPRNAENPVTASGENPMAAAAARSVVLSGMAGTEGAAPEILPAQGPKTGEEKSKFAGGDKKFSLKQGAAEDTRKPGREAGPKKTEKPDAADLLREPAAPRAEETKTEDAARNNIEIRVLVRAGDERFEDSLRMQDDRSVKESASGLLRRMREEGNEHIVKSARFILKDKNEGEIRLVLKPESLGEVRIRLSVQDNLIGGRIFVENESVREVFEQNMPGLASAFRENGLELGGMSVSVGNEGYRENETRQPFPHAAGRAEKESPAASAYEYYFVSNAINFMV